MARVISQPSCCTLAVMGWLGGGCKKKEKTIMGTLLDLTSSIKTNGLHFATDGVGVGVYAPVHQYQTDYIQLPRVEPEWNVIMPKDFRYAQTQCKSARIAKAKLKHHLKHGYVAAKPIYKPGTLEKLPKKSLVRHGLFSPIASRHILSHVFTHVKGNSFRLFHPKFVTGCKDRKQDLAPQCMQRDRGPQSAISKEAYCWSGNDLLEVTKTEQAVSFIKVSSEVAWLVLFSHGNNGNATAQLNETQTTADRSQFSSLEDAHKKKSTNNISCA